MEYDKKPNVIKFEGSKLQVMQQLTDELAVKMGKNKFEWKYGDLKKNVSLAEAFDELTQNLDILGEDYTISSCETHYGSDNASYVRTTTAYSSNKSSVCTRNCNGYEFSSGSSAYGGGSGVAECGGCSAYCSPDVECTRDQAPGI